MTGRSIPPTERENLHQQVQSAPTYSGPCCAKCRRGVRGFGELPCGYFGGNCPNRCHEKHAK